MIVLRAQAAGDLPMDPGEQTDNSRLPVRDRSGRLTTSFDVVLADAGIQGAKIRPCCRKANCYAERIVGTVGYEATDRPPPAT